MSWRLSFVIEVKGPSRTITAAVDVIELGDRIATRMRSDCRDLSEIERELMVECVRRALSSDGRTAHLLAVCRSAAEFRSLFGGGLG
jgi:hypothetical protein